MTEKRKKPIHFEGLYPGLEKIVKKCQGKGPEKAVSATTRGKTKLTNRRPGTRTTLLERGS